MADDKDEVKLLKSDDVLTQVVSEIFIKLTEMGIKDEDIDFFQSRLGEIINTTQTDTLREAIVLMTSGKKQENTEVYFPLNCTKCGKLIWLDTSVNNGGLCTDCSLGFYKSNKGKVSHIVQL